MRRPIIALALGGGAARGWAHIGVLRVLDAAGLQPDLVVGTSIGAIVGGHYVVDRLDALESFARSLTRRKFIGYLNFSMSGSGLITGQRLFDQFNEHLNGAKIETLSRSFVAIATELETGNEIWMRRGSIVDAVRASSAIPGLVRPVRIGRRWLVDGSLVNPIPVSVCRALGAQVVVAVNLNGDRFGRGGTLVHDDNDGTAEDLEDRHQSAAAGGRETFWSLDRWFLASGSEAAPPITSVILDAFAIVHDRIARARLMGDPPDLMISPDLANFGIFDVHRADELIAIGEAAAREQLAAIARRVDAARARIGPHSELAAKVARSQC